MLSLFVILLFFHYLLDYPLQGFLAEAKNPTKAIPGIPWKQAMFAHSFMHGFAVWFMTGWWLFLAIETASHYVTDYLKCVGKINFNQDQAIHIGLKFFYALIFSYYLGFENGLLA